MPDYLTGLAAAVTNAAVVLVLLLVAGFTRPGPRRAGLVAGGLPLALVPAVLSSAYVSWKLIGVFAGMSEAGGGTTRQVLDACDSLWLVARVACGGLAAACGAGVLLGLLRSGAPADDVPCSTRRALVLLLLPVLGLLVAAAVAAPVAGAMRITAAVVSGDAHDPESKRRTDAVLAAQGLPTEGSGSIAAISRSIARGAMVGSFGGALAAVILLGLAATGALLAWRVRFGPWFLAIASTLWLVAGAGGALVAAGVLSPLRL